MLTPDEKQMLEAARVGDCTQLCSHLRSDIRLSDALRGGLADLISDKLQSRKRGRPRKSKPKDGRLAAERIAAMVVLRQMRDYMEDHDRKRVPRIEILGFVRSAIRDQPLLEIADEDAILRHLKRPPRTFVTKKESAEYEAFIALSKG